MKDKYAHYDADDPFASPEQGLEHEALTDAFSYVLERHGGVQHDPTKRGVTEQNRWPWPDMKPYDYVFFNEWSPEFNSARASMAQYCRYHDKLFRVFKEEVPSGATYYHIYRLPDYGGGSDTVKFTIRERLIAAGGKEYPIDMRPNGKRIYPWARMEVNDFTSIALGDQRTLESAHYSSWREGKLFQRSFGRATDPSEIIMYRKT